MTMGNKKNVPAIRFKGFAEEWIKKAFGEFGSISMNRRVFKDQTDSEGEIPFYKIGTFGAKPDSYISRELFEKYKRKYPYPQIGDILISASGSIGHTVEYRGADEYFQDSNIVWLTHDERLSNLFLKYLYSIIKWNGLEGSTIKRLYNKNILDTTFILPNPEDKDKSIEEQTQIGNYFQNIDWLINTSQTKLNKLKNIKKACLEKMFPRNGLNTPELRFKGFTEGWKEMAIEDIASDFYGGGTPRTSIERYWNGNIPWIQTSDLKEDVVFGVVPQKFISNSGVKESATKLVPENSIAVITRVGVGKLALIPFQYATSQDFLSISKLKVDEYFAAYIMHRKMQTVLKEVQGTSIKGVTKEELLAKQVEVPTNRNEQKAIGIFFKNLDDLITKTEQQINKLKNIKKACLDKMFATEED